MTPLIDLFLNILIFFLVTTTFSQDSVFFVELPEATAKEEGQKELKQIVLSVSPTGQVAMDRKHLSLEQLSQELRRIDESRRKDLPVVLRADRGSLHGRVVEVIDVVRQEGFENIGIATKTPPGGD